MILSDAMSVMETQAERRFTLPADYYSTATPSALLPSWATYGCGALSGLILILVFAGGAFLSSGGMVDLMDMVFGMTLGEMRSIYTSDVTPSQKASLEAEIETLRRNVRDGRVTIQRLDPMLQSMRRAAADSKVSGAEVDEMIAAAKRLNAPRPALQP